MRTADRLSTSDLWTATNTALCEGRWSIARRLCEDLSRRSDYTDTLSDVSGYLTALAVRGEQRALDAGFRQLLQDRIDSVNARADRNSESPAAFIFVSVA